MLYYFQNWSTDWYINKLHIGQEGLHKKNQYYDIKVISTRMYV